MIKTWNEKLKTNIPIIDEQHGTIINLLQGIKTSKLSKANVYNLLSELQEVLYVHFDAEETYMREDNYPDYIQHKAAHDQVRQDYKKILTKYDADYSSSEIALELIQYIQKWFFEHYENSDLKMAEYLIKKSKL